MYIMWLIDSPGPYEYADRIVLVKGPYSFRKKDRILSARGPYTLHLTPLCRFQFYPLGSKLSNVRRFQQITLIMAHNGYFISQVTAKKVWQRKKVMTAKKSSWQRKKVMTAKKSCDSEKKNDWAFFAVTNFFSLSWLFFAVMDFFSLSPHWQRNTYWP